VLVLREFHVHLPAGRLRATGVDRQQSFGDAMREAARRAARPAHGPVPAQAEAVLFVDHAELLMCFTRDVLARALADCWWWRDLAMPRTARSEPLVHVWVTEARALPQCLSALHPHERRAAIRLLSASQSREVLDAVCAAYEVPTNKNVLPSPPLEAASAPTPPWRAWSEAARTQPVIPEREELLGILLVLAATPHVARSHTFLEQWHAWRSVAAAPAVNPERSGYHASAPRQPMGVARALHHRGLVSEAAVVSATRPAAARSESRLARPGTERHTTTPRDSEVTAQPEVQEFAVLMHGDLVGSHAGGITEDTRFESAPRRPALPASYVQHGIVDPFLERGERTTWGGILYLINLLDWLGAPATWSSDYVFDRLSGWAAVELLAHGLIGLTRSGPAGSELLADPMFGVLEALDGRSPHTLAGAGLRPARTFLLPPNWLARFSTHTWTVDAGAGRVRMWDVERGYLVADLPRNRRVPSGEPGRESDPANVAGVRRWYAERRVNATLESSSSSAARLDELAKRRLLPYRGSACVSRGAWAWLRSAIGFVDALLTNLLGDQLPLTTLHTKGWLTLTRTHLDLVLPLDGVDLAVRGAGLDRDPGWRPDLGRIIQFHFE
jgi:hypothetical protein